MTQPRPQATKRVNKFNFSDYRFASFVRQRMLEVLIQFDVNNNRQFEE